MTPAPMTPELRAALELLRQERWALYEYRRTAGLTDFARRCERDDAEALALIERALPKTEGPGTVPEPSSASPGEGR